MPTGSTSSHILNVFLSYADEDRSLVDELIKHLSILLREGSARLYHKYQTDAGNDWKEQVRQKLYIADIILLLVSASFIASDYCYGEEAAFAMIQQKNGKARVIPIILRPVEWKQLIFGSLKSLPEGEAVSMWLNKEEALSEIVRGVKATIDDLRSKVSLPAHSTEKPVSIWNVRYWQNSFFTGRDATLLEIHKAFKASGTPLRIQALSGLAGIGKTQAAVEYAYRYANTYQAVLWVHADSPEILQASFVNLAATLNLPELHDTDQHVIIKAVKQWMQRNTRWLLVIDNLEDINLLQEFIPSPHPGHILITTRTHYTGYIAQRVHFLPLLTDDGALLLLRRAKLLSPRAMLNEALEADRTFAREITRSMDGLPLALDQAGAYIEETGRSLADYVNLYQKYLASLLQRRGTSNQDHPASVMTTFALSLEKVQTLNTAAAELLEFCAFLHPDSIPEELFIEGASELQPALQAAVTDPLLFDKTIEDLLKFSLIQRKSDQHILTIHRLVQMVIKSTLSEERQRDQIARLTRVMSTIFPPAEFANWALCQRYLPQAQACARLIQQQHILLPEAAQLLYRIGTYLIERGLYNQAEELLTQAMTIETTLFGPDHTGLLPISNALAQTYYIQGKYYQAEALLLQAIEMGEKLLEGRHPEQGISLYTLARTYHKLGRYNEAELLFQRALALQQQVLSTQHPDIATTLSGLGSLYNRLGKYAEAEELFTRALHIRQNVLAIRHPDVTNSLSNLALLYSRLGKYTEAEPLAEQATHIYEEIFGPEHPHLAAILDTLAAIYQEQGKYTEAETLYQRIFAIFHAHFGDEHPNLVIVKNNAARLYFLQEKYAEAENTAQQALTLGEKVLEPNHHRIAASFCLLADIARMQEKYSDAESFYLKALALYETSLGARNVTLISTLEKYADLLLLLQRETEAETIKTRAESIRNEPHTD